jgi:hypothetical protein
MTNQITEAMIDAGAHVLGMATAAHLTGAPRTLAEQVIAAALATETNGIVDDTPVPQSASPDAELVERVALVIGRAVEEATPLTWTQDAARAAIEALTATTPHETGDYANASDRDRTAPDDLDEIEPVYQGLRTYARDRRLLVLSIADLRRVARAAIADLTKLATTPPTDVGYMQVPTYDRCDTYVAGQYVFNYLRTFLTCAGIDASKCRLVIELPDRDTQRQLVSAVQRDSKGPPRSAGKIGNHSGIWQGVEYEFAFAAPPSDTRPTNCRFRLQDEDKAYPKSACQACGATVVTGLGKSCTRTRQPTAPPTDTDTKGGDA